MGLFDMLQISGSALSAERQRAEVVAANLANAETTHTDAGGPFRRREVVFHAQTQPRFGMLLASTAGLHSRPQGGVNVSEVVDDPTPAVRRYQPGHPDADKEGYVSYPAINPLLEMVDLMGSVRAYQMNASAVSAAKGMIQQSIDILKS
ncbi:MAG TPA: flagellar basal body rod protein FlgC [Acidisarcina sp.]